MVGQLDVGRRLAARICLVQVAIAVMIGLVWLAEQGPRAAIAAAGMALAVAVGTALLGWSTFRTVAAVGKVWLRLMLGMLLKWLVVLGSLSVVIGIYKLPAVAALTGLVAAYAVNWLAFRMRVG